MTFHMGLFKCSLIWWIPVCMVFTLFCELSAFNLTTKVIETNSGYVRGLLRHTMFDSKPYYSFLGIPYGKPPVGDLIFKPPVAADPWDGILNCYEFGPKCLQKERGSGLIVGSQNCLKLNVFVPAKRHGEKLPVMFYMMGGAYMSGSSSCYGPDFLINQDVILVTFDYRLGPYGFLSLGTPEYSGNMALKDQLLALKWVNNNIEKFGGNASSITVFGQSAGATSINIHLVSPAAKGLFQKAIMSSGSLLDPWAFHYGVDSLDIILPFSEKHGGPSVNGPELVKFITSVDAATLLIDTYVYFVQGAPPITIVPNWLPVIENENATEPIITQSPITLFLQGKQSDIPTLFGFNADESLYFIPTYLKEPKLIEPFNDDFKVMLPYSFLKYDYNSNNYAKAAEQIKYFYFNNEYIGNNTMRQMSYLLTDAFFAYTARKSALLQSHGAPDKTFYYKNSMVTRLNLFRQFCGAPADIPGATHGDELFYIFKISGPLFYHPISNIYAHLSVNSLEVQLINVMTSTLANFAKTGNPKPSNSLKPSLPIGKHVFNYIHFTNFGVFISKNPDHRRMAFWRDFFNKNIFDVNKLAYCSKH